MELPGEDIAKDVLVQTSKQGPLALLAVMLVLFMLAGISAIGYVLIPVMRDYVFASTQTIEDNAKSFSSLSNAMATVHQAHASLMQSTEATQAAVVENGTRIEELQVIVTQMADIVQEARTLMQGVPAQRVQQHEEQIKKLEAIDQSIQHLVQEIQSRQP